MVSRSKVTLKGMASDLGLSPATVSRVLNDPDGIKSRWASPETSRRILDHAHDLGYVKNPYAASLRTSESHLIGVVVPRLQDYVLATIYEGIDEAATENGYVSVVANSLDDTNLHDLRVRKLLDRRIDGLILGDTPFDGSLLRSIANENIPFVLVNRRSPGYLSVTCNDFLGGWLVGNHLAGLGAKKIFLLAGNRSMSTSMDRTAGLIDALEAHGVSLPASHIVSGGFDATSGEKGIKELIGAHGVPDAVFATNDFAAIGALGVLRQRGLNAPDDVKLVGYNDTPLAGAVGLTTVHSPMHEMGRVGFEFLLGAMRGEDRESVQLDPKIVIRESA